MQLAQYDKQQALLNIEQWWRRTVQAKHSNDDKTKIDRPPLEELLVCPISLQTMRDPVMLMPSGITFDREHLCQWLLQSPTRDPTTGAQHKKPLEYAPNLTARNVLSMLHGDEAYQKFDDSLFRVQYAAAWKALLRQERHLRQEQQLQEERRGRRVRPFAGLGVGDFIDFSLKALGFALLNVLATWLERKAGWWD